ncbi:MAG: flavin reductase family protein [Dehalococcoidia bacterium]|nr:flavin reductase family protein [Dehalococcoidia bacterium]
MADAIDPRRFRDVMGRFATGVTVVTLAAEGQLRGMTANAFSSVSLEPPLLLVCVDQNASIYPMFHSAEAFAVNILASDQAHVSQLFATKGEKSEVMGGHAHSLAPLGSPVLDGVIAWAECRIEHRYEGGDHLIVVGRIHDLEVAQPEGAPLLFFSGQYRALGDPILPQG